MGVKVKVNSHDELVLKIKKFHILENLRKRK